MAASEPVTSDAAPATRRHDATLTRPSDADPAVASDPASAIVDAAARCFARWGIPRTRVEDIAAEVGIARPHIYRHFASKDAIVHAVVLRVIRRHHDRLAARYPLQGPVAAIILGSLLSGIQETAANPDVAFLLGSPDLTARSLTSSPEVVAELRTHWIPVLEYAKKRKELRRGLDIDDAARWLVFVQFSYLALPDMVPPPEALESDLRAFVLPALLR